MVLWIATIAIIILPEVDECVKYQVVDECVLDELDSHCLYLRLVVITEMEFELILMGVWFN